MTMIIEWTLTRARTATAVDPVTNTPVTSLRIDATLAGYRKYARTVRCNQFGSRIRVGYVMTWASTGFIAFAVVSLFDTLTEDPPAVAQVVAVVAFAAGGIYQLPP